MKLVRLLVVSAAPPLAWALVLGCGSGGGYRGAFTESGVSGAQSSGAGGASGAGGGAGGFGAEGGLAAGSGGIAGQAGASGTDAGFAGMGGLGGAAGDGASGAAGSGGSGGFAAMSGAGGSAAAAGSGAGGMAGVGVSGASSGGVAGSSGSLRTCAERCNVNADCRVFSVDLGHRCNSSTHRCERFAEPCRSSVECIPGASAWIFSCTTDMDCFFFSDDLCVDVGGVGRCARVAPSANGCGDSTPDEITLPRFGVSGNALVCANTSRVCAEGTCVPGCANSTDCTPEQNGSVCDSNTRLCRCAGDQDCGGPGVSRCNTATGRCECASDQDCAEIPNANVCTAGRCGCSSVSACNAERAFSGTTNVCE
jgi:hypothetical protein